MMQLLEQSIAVETSSGLRVCCQTRLEAGHIEWCPVGKVKRGMEELVQALQEIWDTVPSSYEPDDPMVQRHACALNRIPDLLATIEGAD